MTFILHPFHSTSSLFLFLSCCLLPSLCPSHNISTSILASFKRCFMSGKHRCSNEFCNMTFSTKKSKQKHNKECYGRHIATQQSLPLIEQPLFGYNNNSIQTAANEPAQNITHSSTIMQSTHQQDINPDEATLRSLKQMILKKFTDLDDYQKHMLSLWFSNFVPISVSDVVSQPKSGKTGLSIHIPKYFSNKNRTNVVKNAQKCLYRIVDKHIDIVKTIQIKIGPFVQNGDAIYSESSISYRPIKTLLMSLLTDDSMWSLGSYIYKPRELKDIYLCGHFVESKFYDDAYKKITHHFGSDIEVIPFPILLWGDGARFLERSQYGSSHVFALIPLLYASYVQSNKNRGTKVISFSREDFMDQKASSTIQADLRASSKSKYLDVILGEMNELMTTGIKTSRGLFLPFIAVVVGDVLELRSLTCSGHCPLCLSHDKKEIKEFQLNKANNYQRNGNLLSMVDRDESYEFSHFQDTLKNQQLNPADYLKISDHMKRMKQYFSTHKRKLIISAVERIQYPDFMGELHVNIFIDRMHCIISNETKYLLSFIISKLTKESLNIMSQRSKDYVNFPCNYINEPNGSWKASDISKASIYLVLMLCDQNISINLKDDTRLDDLILALTAMVFVICISAKEKLTRLDIEGEQSDLEILTDMSRLLGSCTYFNGEDRDNVHIFIEHFLDMNAWRYICSPRHISSSIGESYIASIKKALQSSNKGKNWPANLLKRLAIFDICFASNNDNMKCSIDEDPEFRKVFKLQNGKIEIGYVDLKRNSMYIDSRSVSFNIHNGKSTMYSICATRFNKRMQITEIMNVNNKEKNVYHYLQEGDILFKGFILEDIPADVLSKYRKDNRSIPHTGLWTILYPKTPCIIDLTSVIGGCYHVDMGFSIIGILNHTYSHILCGNESVVSIPDSRYW